MKFNKVAAICKSRKRITIHTDPESGAQWLGDGMAMYLLEGMPRLTPEECLRLFDIPESKHTDFYCTAEDLPTGIEFSDAIGAENEGVKDKSITIGWLGEVFRLFMYEKELYAINEMYLTPFAGDTAYILYHRRKMAGGGFLLGVNIGLGLQAVIAPYMVHRQEPYMAEMVEITEAMLYMQRNFPRPPDSQSPQMSNDENQLTLETEY